MQLPHQSPSLTTVHELFTRYKKPYWVAGGWAIDLLVGKVRRDHSDVDVLILKRDLPQFTDAFRAFKFFIKDQSSGESRPWDGAEDVEPGRDTLYSTDAAFNGHDVEILLALNDEDDWLFHRGKRSRRALDTITHRAPNGLPYLGPEIVLLLKARDGRDKDDADFFDAVNMLTNDQAGWLLPRLSPPGRENHPWSARLQEHLDTFASSQADL